MDKHAAFSNTWLAVLFVLPQLLLIFIFFYWPTGEAMYWAFTLEQPFGGSNQWVGLLNFETVFADPKYWNSVLVSILRGDTIIVPKGDTVLQSGDDIVALTAIENEQQLLDILVGKVEG